MLGDKTRSNPSTQHANYVVYIMLLEMSPQIRAKVAATAKTSDSSDTVPGLLRTTVAVMSVKTKRWGWYSVTYISSIFTTIFFILIAWNSNCKTHISCSMNSLMVTKYNLTNITRVTTKVGWHMACVVEKWMHTWVWWGKLKAERMGWIWRPRHSWENNFQLNFKETGW